MNSECPVCKKQKKTYYNSNTIICEHCITTYGIKNSSGDTVKIGIEDGIYYCESGGDYSNEREFTVNGLPCYAISYGIDVMLVSTISIPFRN